MQLIPSLVMIRRPNAPFINGRWLGIAPNAPPSKGETSPTMTNRPDPRREKTAVNLKKLRDAREKMMILSRVGGTVKKHDATTGGGNAVVGDSLICIVPSGDRFALASLIDQSPTTASRGH